MEQKVRYPLEVDDRLCVIDKVPARVNVETGEQYFSPETVAAAQAAYEACERGYGRSR